jgi:hypothetical protein
VRCHFKLQLEADGTAELAPAIILRHPHPEYWHRKNIYHQYKLTTHPDYIGKFQKILFVDQQRNGQSKLK